MSEKFESLQNKIKDVDKEKLTDLVQDVKQAAENGEISDSEKDELVQLATERLGEPFSGFNI
jgi:hypothetical protein